MLGGAGLGVLSWHTGQISRSATTESKVDQLKSVTAEMHGSIAFSESSE